MFLHWFGSPSVSSVNLCISVTIVNVAKLSPHPRLKIGMLSIERQAAHTRHARDRIISTGFRALVNPVHAYAEKLGQVGGFPDARPGQIEFLLCARAVALDWKSCNVAAHRSTSLLLSLLHCADGGLHVFNCALGGWSLLTRSCRWLAATLDGLISLPLRLTVNARAMARHTLGRITNRALRLRVVITQIAQARTKACRRIAAVGVRALPVELAAQSGF